MNQEQTGEQCQRCGEVGNDRRTLWMACLYDMEELELPFQIRNLTVPKTGANVQEFYTLRVCKQCRADWMHTIQTWFRKGQVFGPGPKCVSATRTGVFVRNLGVSRELVPGEVEQLKRKKQDADTTYQAEKEHS